MKRICVFCGSQVGKNQNYAKQARNLGQLMAQKGLGLVYGGGRVGLMGIVAEAVLTSGSEVIGVIPRKLAVKEIAYDEVSELHVVETMHERKALMAKKADAFIAMPGGFGTLDELCEIITWAQLQYHHKPIGLLNVDGYFDGFLAFVEHAIDHGFIKKEHKELFVVSQSEEELLRLLNI